MGAYLVESSQKDTTHEARKNYPQTIFREDLTFIRPCIRRRSGFVVFLLHWYNIMRGIRGCGVRAGAQGIVRHGMWKVRVLDRLSAMVPRLSTHPDVLGSRDRRWLRHLRHPFFQSLRLRGFVSRYARYDAARHLVAAWSILSSVVCALGCTSLSLSDRIGCPCSFSHLALSFRAHCPWAFQVLAISIRVNIKPPYHIVVD